MVRLCDMINEMLDIEGDVDDVIMSVAQSVIKYYDAHFPGGLKTCNEAERQYFSIGMSVALLALLGHSEQPLDLANIVYGESGVRSR